VSRITELVNSHARNQGSIYSPRQPPTQPYDADEERTVLVLFPIIANLLDKLPFSLFEDLNFALKLHSELRVERVKQNEKAALGGFDFDRRFDGRYKIQCYQLAHYTTWYVRDCLPSLLQYIYQ
jgi:hypothetical protein